MSPPRPLLLLHWAVAALEQWFLHRPVRFVVAGVMLSVAWTSAILLFSTPLEIERSVQPVLGQQPVRNEVTQVLLGAPLLENAVLWAVFRAAAFAAHAWQKPVAWAVALAVFLFCVAHMPFKVLLGAEMLALAWLMTMCFQWGLKHRRAWRGYVLSVAVHLGVNLIALGLYYSA